jgi:hypothetical protein
MRNCPSSGFRNERLRAAAGTLICSSHGPLTKVAEEKAIIIPSFDLRINEKSRNINQTYANVFPS